MENRLEVLIVFGIMTICLLYSVFNAVKKFVYSLGKCDFLNVGLYGCVTLLLMGTWVLAVDILAELLTSFA